MQRLKLKMLCRKDLTSFLLFSTKQNQNCGIAPLSSVEGRKGGNEFLNFAFCSLIFEFIRLKILSGNLAVFLSSRKNADETTGVR